MSDPTQTPTAEPQQQSAAPPQPGAAPAPDQDWKRLYSESSTEGKRLAEEKKQLEVRASQYEAAYNQLAAQQQYAAQQAAAAPVAAPVHDTGGDYENILSNDEAQKLADAYLAGNAIEIRRMEGLKAKRAADTQMRELGTIAQRQVDENAAYASLQQAGWQDLQNNTSLAQKTLQKYQQLESQRSLYKEVRPLAVGNMQFHPLMLRDAIREARLELGAVHSAAVDVARATSEHFVEPSTRTPTGPLGEPLTTRNFDAGKHLADYERAYCDKRGISYEKHWENMDDSLKEARISQGKPVTSTQLGLREIKYSIPSKR